MALTPGSFSVLPASLSAKSAPALTAADDEHFAAVAAYLDHARTDLAGRLAAARRAPGGTGQHALDRDQEVHRLTARLRALSRFDADLCLGRMVTTDGTTIYIGRFGLTDDDDEQLLVDWRSPAAEPFFAATHAHPMGLVSRRRYRWGRPAGARAVVVDFWDEVFDPALLVDETERAALDDQSAFIASLGASRSERMRDVLATLQSDQDAIIRSEARSPLVVSGGPGTGKTVVALHRTAHLLHADPRLAASAARRTGGVLVLGPSEPYLAYVADVLPSLGEEDVLTATLRDLVPEGAGAVEETDALVASLKGSVEMATTVVDAAVALYEEPPTEPLWVSTELADVRVGPTDWAAAFDAVESGTPHNEAREQVWDALLDLLVDQAADALDEGFDDDDDGERAGQAASELRRALRRHSELRRAVERAWPLLRAADVVGDLWTVPAYLRRCAPHLTREEVLVLRRPDAAAWTTADLPILDAAHRRLGDPDGERRRRRRERVAEAERRQRNEVVADLLAGVHETGGDEYGVGLLSSLRHADAQSVLVDESGLDGLDSSGAGGGGVGVERLAGPFGHVVVDEAQELSDAAWQCVLARCPSRSLTVVGDRAQARDGFAESWEERLARVGLGAVRVATLSTNYRTPVEVMAEAEPVIRAALPDVDVPTSVRSTGVPVHHGRASELEPLLRAWLAEHAEGTACVVTGDPSAVSGLVAERVRVLTPALAKGLEFDVVVLLDPLTDGLGVNDTAAAVDRYVAMTRATQRLAVLTP
ncbi:DNA helicase IV [Quadrisphaera granulorum]|uniref:DNA helicase IV n=1 Tax=Quadrisphaera granulorum TaxID=317664 RepID=A0A316A8I6_9ACTN|nr:RNA polymerase recycling motor ATPase HelR [Quadrisphaera granulorum]PWJ54236.1 DNA helicase IV [Quadrisphaera granulorum]SZE96375.1 DNA helicase IV [Quadrisphaera granulorum]